MSKTTAEKAESNKRGSKKQLLNLQKPLPRINQLPNQQKTTAKTVKNNCSRFELLGS